MHSHTDAKSSVIPQTTLKSLLYTQRLNALHYTTSIKGMEANQGSQHPLGTLALFLFDEIRTVYNEDVIWL